MFWILLLVRCLGKGALFRFLLGRFLAQMGVLETLGVRLAEIAGQVAVAISPDRAKSGRSRRPSSRAPWRPREAGQRTESGDGLGSEADTCGVLG